MKPLKEAGRILAVLGAIFLIGVLGYHIIEGWPFFDALYMTVITLATVGYGETHPLSTAGRVFTISLILGGMGIILYGITEVTSFIVEGEMSGILRRRRMNRMIKKLSNHYILCGWGNTGYYVLEEMERTHRPCVVVEKDVTKVSKLAEKDALVVEGDATEDATLVSAGIRRAGGLVTTLPTDKDNMFVVITARGLNPSIRIVAKIDDVSSRDKFLRSGANIAISADFIGGLRMVSELVRPATTSFLDTMLRDRSGLRVEDVQVSADSKYASKTLSSCDVFTKVGVLILSIKQGDSFQFNPPPDTVLNGGDTLIVIGNPEQIRGARSALNHS
jgi:voltage-gated potassium channel